MPSSGGIAAAFGFRYQYVVTVEILLDLYQDARLTSWFVDVDLEGQDSADILVRKAGGNWDTAVQVKASQVGSRTTMGPADVRRILDSIAVEHPAVSERQLVTNRVLTQELADNINGSQWSLGSRERVIHHARGLSDLIHQLLERVADIRQRGAGGLQIHHIVLAQLIDLVHQCGSDRFQPRIVRSDVDRILAEPAALLADAARERSWGREIQVPQGRPIARPDLDSFLETQLPLGTLETGLVRCAVFSGLSGTGKTSSVLHMVQRRLENLAFVLWLDASSDSSLQVQLPLVLEELGASNDGGDPAATLRAALGQVPVPWLLVLDNAADVESTARWVPRSGYGHVVVTSKSRAWPGDFAASARVLSFSVEEARSFLATRFEVPVSQWSDEQREACDELARHLEYWPLALELATAWIQQRDGEFGQICNFVDRLDRLDLDDVSLVPNGYPATAYRVVRDLLDRLPDDAKTLAMGIALMGGHRVPLTLLDAWAAKLASAEGVRHELVRQGVVALSLHPDRRGPHVYDETAEMHDAIRLILERSRQGVPIEARALAELVEVCADQVELLISGERFIEAATLLPPVNALLERCVTNFPATRIPGEWTALMHNVGTLASIIDDPVSHPVWTTRIARRWLAIAVNIRRSAADGATPVEVAALQIETIGALAYVLHQLQEDDELLHVARLAVEYGEAHGPALNQIGKNVPEALSMIRKAVEQRRLGDRELQDNLRSLENLTSHRQRRSAAPLIDELQRDMLHAIDMVEHASLADGLDLALRTTETAVVKGVLATKSINCLLDIGAVLLMTVAQRPADNKDPRRLIIRLLKGLAPLTEHLSPSQCARTSLLEATATRDGEKLRQAIADARRVADDMAILEPWISVAERISDQYASQSLFTNLAEGISVVHSSDNLLSWEAVDTDRNVPMLFIHNPGAFVIDSAGKHPSGHTPFVEAGLSTTSDPAETRPPAHGWCLRIQHDGLWIYAPDGQALVQQIPTSLRFTNLMRRVGGVLLVYHDATQPITDWLTAPAGWITVPRTLGRRGWRRFIPW